MEIFCRYSGKLLAVDEAPTVKEGNWPYTRTVLIEFPTAEAFDAWFNSQEYQASLEGRNVELLGDGIGSNALDAIVTALTWDIPEQGSPRVWWFYGTGSAKALTTELTKELWFNPAMYTRFKVMIA